MTEQIKRSEGGGRDNSKLATNHNYFMRCVVLEIITIVKATVVSSLGIGFFLLLALNFASNNNTEYIVPCYLLAFGVGFIYLVIIFICGNKLRKLHDSITSIEDLWVKDSFHNLSSEE